MDLHRQLSECIKLMDGSDISYLSVKRGDFEFTLSKSSSPGVTTVVHDGPLPSDRPVLDAPARSGAADAGSVGPSASSPVKAAPASPGPSDVPATDPGVMTVRAPLLGTFYVAPEPGADPFVAVGDQVSDSSTIGLLEAMKMFTAVPAGFNGLIEQLLVTDGQLVEFDQPIALIRTG